VPRRSIVEQARISATPAPAEYEQMFSVSPRKPALRNALGICPFRVKSSLERTAASGCRLNRSTQHRR
jgi:hypothetical protein